MWFSSRLASAVAALGILGVAGCHRPAADPRAGPPKGEVAVRVVNQSLSDVVIYLVESGVRSRLGTAYGGATSVFFVAWQRVEGAGTVRLLGDPIGGPRAIVTDPLSVRAGSMVVWTLERVLPQSYTAVY
jgi:hypothetical protein